MANSKISALPVSGALTGIEELPIVQGGVTKKVSTQTIANLATAYTADESTLTLSGSQFQIKSQTSVNFMAKISDATGTGVMVRNIQPVFGTDITTPLIIGGTAVGSTISYKGTSGNGTSTIAAHQFLVGNNGGTTAMSVYNSGNINIGNYVTTNQRILRIGQDTAVVDIGSIPSSTSVGGLWFNTGSPSVSTVALYGNGVFTQINAPSSYVQVSVVNQTKAIFNVSSTLFTPSAASILNTNFTFTTSADTGQTASTNSPNFKVTGSTKQWATGALATQYFNHFSANTVSFTSASTASNVYGLYVEAATAGANATITNNFAAGFSGNVQITGALNVVGITNTGNASFQGFLNMNSQPIRFLAGTAASPGLHFESNTCGIFSNTSNVLGFATSGTSRITLTTTELTISDAYNLSFNTTTGTKIGTATTQKIGFWNATPIVQPASVSQAAVSGTAGALYTATEQTLINDLKTLVNQLRADLVAAGNIKGSA